MRSIATAMLCFTLLLCVRGVVLRWDCQLGIYNACDDIIKKHLEKAAADVAAR